MRKGLPKKAQKRANRRLIQELETKLTQESGKITGWIILAILTLPTIIVPYLCYGYVKKALDKKDKLKQNIKSLS